MQHENVSEDKQYSTISSACDDMENQEIRSENQQSKSKSTLVDSGSSAHLTNDANKFISFQEDFEPETHAVALADRGVEKLAEKKGKGVENFQDKDGKIHSISLKDTLYCPSIPQDMFSVKAIARNENAIVILGNKNSKLILGDGTTFPIYEQDGGLYYLNTIDKKDEETVTACKSKMNMKVASHAEWHRIMGHTNRGDLLRLESVMDDRKISNKSDFECETCTLSKQVVNIN